MFLFIHLLHRFSGYFPQFKYISCSYLSLGAIVPSYKSMIFKYISCSYLSQLWRQKARKKNNSNTSHVLIYPIFLPVNMAYSSYSNTSHVLIYQSLSCYSVTDWSIQIHLMFLFITSSSASDSSPSSIQIHLMFLFI